MAKCAKKTCVDFLTDMSWSHEHTQTQHHTNHTFQCMMSLPQTQTVHTRGIHRKCVS